MSWHLILALQLLVSLMCCVFGLTKGGPAERAGSALILLFYIGDEIAFKTKSVGFPVSAIFAGDFILAVGLLAIAIRYSSLWLGCAMMLQSINLCSQGLALSGDGLDAYGQLWLNNVLSMMMMACVVAGAIASWRRRSKARSNSKLASAPAPFSVSIP